MFAWIKRHPIWTACIVVGLFGLVFFMQRSNTPKPPEVIEDVVSRGDVLRTVSASGKLRAQNTVAVGAEITGLIQELNVDFNSEVKKGQLLARIDPTRFEANVTQAKAQVALSQATYRQAEAQITRAKAQIILQERELARRMQLLNNDFVSKAAVDSTQAALDIAKADLEAGRAAVATAQAQITQAQAGLERAELDLRRTRIVAPIDGVVINRTVDLGQTVVSSFQAPNLFEIAQDLALMRVEASVDEADIGQIKLGQTVNFQVDAYPGEVFTGRVKQIRKASREQQNVVSYLVLLDVANPDNKLLPGMTANINIVTGIARDVLRIPTAALRYRPRLPKGAGNQAQEVPAKTGEAAQPRKERTGPTLYRKDDQGFPQAVPVKIGLQSEEFTQILSTNLKPQDKVIIRAKPKLGGRENN
jgi:HlyD family secretion protein